MLAQDRYVQTIALFCAHVARRIPPVVKAIPPPPEPSSKGTNNKRDSTKAVMTRKGKYGESKMKRDTRDAKKKQGHELKKENK